MTTLRLLHSLNSCRQFRVRHKGSTGTGTPVWRSAPLILNDCCDDEATNVDHWGDEMNRVQVLIAVGLFLVLAVFGWRTYLEKAAPIEGFSDCQSSL